MSTSQYLVTADAIGIPGEAPAAPPVPVVPATTMPTYAYRNDLVDLPDDVAKDLLEHGVIKPLSKATDEEKAAAEAKVAAAKAQRADAELMRQREAAAGAAIAAAQQKAQEAADAAAAAQAAATSTATPEEQAAARDELAKAQAAATPTAKQKLLLEAEDMGLDLTGTAQALQERIDAEKKLREGDGTGE